jgi:hypothetical protein
MSLLEPSPPEQQLVDAAGALVDFRAGQAVSDDTAEGSGWGADRTVRAEFLRELLTGARGNAGSRGTGALNVRGARIVGGLDLEGVDLTCPIRLEDCWFEEPVNLCEARAASIRLPGCHLPGLEARQLEVRGNLFLGNGLSASRLNLSGAHVNGVLNLDNAVLDNPGGTTLSGSGLLVDQGMHCSGLTSRGAISLIGARMMGGLVLTGARLENSQGWALDAQGMTVSYALFIGSSYDDWSGLTVEGGLRLVGVRVDGFVCGWGAHIKAGRDYGYAVAALGLTVTENLLLGEGFTADGIVHLTNAQVGDEISLDGASLTNPGGQALVAERLVVGESLLCTNGFRARGAINLAGAKIGGSLDFTGADLSDPAMTGLNLQGISAQALTMRPDGRAAQVDLRHVSVVVLDDDPETWPARQLLRNFSYERFENDSVVSVRMRLDWLQRDLEGYIPQPYEQLVSTYQRAGREEAARRVAVAKQQRRRQALNPVSKVWNWLLYLTIGYGYRTWQAGLWLLAFTLMGTAAFYGAYPAHITAIRPHPMTFNAPVYALDVLLPIIDLGQQDSWQPTGIALYAYWTFIIVGWVLTSAFVAGITGIFKRD